MAMMSENYFSHLKDVLLNIFSGTEYTGSCRLETRLHRFLVLKILLKSRDLVFFTTKLVLKIRQKVFPQNTFFNFQN
jgi:hypothetical protein